ncbi:MAG: hypothetical protein XD69_0562 [Clostridia bacterium 62_21]|nr:MAG: hypothetical protein XD69_0562 [Clostridia bacterium 62_21]HAG07113.1 hypothetical protein [Peptococcaceae bacterium]
MTLAQLRQKLIAIGYHPEEVDYQLKEMLHDARVEEIKQYGEDLVLTLLQARLDVARACKARVLG